MRTAVFAASTVAIGLAGCDTQPAFKPNISIRPLDEPSSRNPKATHLLSFNTPAEMSLPDDAMIAVSRQCDTTDILTEDEVDMTFESNLVPLVEDGPDVYILSYSFRCPEPGKEIQ